MEGTVLHICISDKKGTTKKPVQSANLIENHGLENDAHAGSGHRQVSLLDEADIDRMRAKGIKLSPGAFGENLVVWGLDLAALGIGTRLEIGGAELEITQIGKVCHTPCVIYDETGDCIMPDYGLFAKVNKGGIITPNTTIKPVKIVSREVIQAAVLTVSDSRSSGKAIDTAGPSVSDILKNELDAMVSWTGIIPDEASLITDTLKELTERGIDLIFTVGGTGCGHRDNTPEATIAIIEREVPGLAEAMRSASAQITPHALLQRGVCGIFKSTLIINLPGSKKAATENLSVIIPALPHAVELLRGKTAHTNF